jgi:hypothetical protein
MTEQIHRAKINKSNCVFVLSFDLFIFALCICSVIRLVYLRSVYLFCHSTCLSLLCVFVLPFESNDRTNTQNEDKQVKWQNKCTQRRKASQMTEQIHRAKINKSNCVFVLSFDLFIFALCICSVIWLVYPRSVYLFCHSTCLSSLCVFVLSFESNDRTNTQNEVKQVKLQNKYTERR